MQLSKSEIDKIVTAHGEGMRKALGDADGQRSSNRPAIYPAGGRVRTNEQKSIGEAFVSSDGYRGWVERFPTGGPSGPGEYRSDPVEIKLAMQDASRQIKARSLFTLSETSGGALSDTQFAGLCPAGSYGLPSCASADAYPGDERPGRVRQGGVTNRRRCSRRGSDRHHRRHRIEGYGMSGAPRR